MARAPRVSVVMPAYNTAATLGEALESLEMQSFSDWELVLVDDGSSDGTLELARDWAARDRRIRTFMHQNRANMGRPASRNLAVAQAAGEIVAFLDADDLLLPHALSTHVAAMDRWGEIGVAYGRAKVVREGHGGEVIGRGLPDRPALLFRQLARFNVVVTSAVSVRRRVLSQGIFPPDMPLGQDWACWLSLARHAAFLFIPEVIAKYRVHPGGGTEQMQRRGDEHGYVLAQARYLRSLLSDAPAEERTAIRCGLVFRTTVSLLRAASEVRRGRLLRAAGWLATAVRSSDSPILLVHSMARVLPEQARIWRREDPPLTITAIGPGFRERRVG